MSIQKKSLIGNLKAAKKAIIATNSSSVSSVPSNFATKNLASKNLFAKGGPIKSAKRIHLPKAPAAVGKKFVAKAVLPTKLVAKTVLPTKKF